MRRIDPGFAIVLAISLVAIWPFLSRASLPLGTDAELHIFRLVELSHLVRAGELYPRWAPDFYHGYGYPIFNYYAPLTYYLGLVVELLPRLDAVDGVKAVFVLGMLLGGTGIYGFTRDNWGRRAGYVAASVYLYAPYIQYIDPHARGVLAESFSFGLFPLALWALDRLRRNGGGRLNWLVAVFLVAAVILSHNLMALVFYGLLSAWVLWTQLIGLTSWKSAAWAYAALLLGLGTAAFFWLPVLLERDLVNLNTLIGNGGNYDFHTHFLSLKEMFALSSRLDWGAAEPAFSFNFGLAQWLLAGVGMFMVISRRLKNPTSPLFFVLGLFFLSFMMHASSTFIWESLPFLPFFQFPWRLLGPSAIFMAILAGAGVSVFVNKPDQSAWVTAVLALVPVVLGLPLSQPVPWQDFGPASLRHMSDLEQKGYWLGTTSTADYVPATVEMTPGRIPSLLEGLYQGGPLDWVNWAVVPAETTIEIENITPLHVRYTIEASENFRFRLFLFDFPGWQVKINGDRVETELGLPEGLIVVPLTRGKQVVDVNFGTTPARSLAWLLAAICLGAALIIAWRMEESRQIGERLKQVDWGVGGAVLLLTAVFVFWLDPSGLLHQSSSGNTAVPADVDLFADFGGQIALIGFDASETTLNPGDTLRLTLYWKAQQDLDINYQVFVHILRMDGSLIQPQSDKLNPGDFPTRRWDESTYVRDEHQLKLPADFPPGKYTVTTGFWVQAEGWRLPLLNPSGQQIGDRIQLFDLNVVP